jgi:hypothetical protein
MLDRRRIAGRLAYLDAAGNPTGRELFSISVHGDGSRTLRAQCEMDDDALVRDAILVLDAGARPAEAFVRVVENGTASGSAHFTDLSAHDYFGTHALINDGWVSFAGAHLADGESVVVRGLACSHQANGGGAPKPMPSEALLTRIGAEALTVAAGRFETVHWTVTYQGHTPIDMWTTGEDRVLVLMTWDHLNGRYELVQLDESHPAP